MPFFHISPNFIDSQKLIPWQPPKIDSFAVAKTTKLNSEAHLFFLYHLGNVAPKFFKHFRHAAWHTFFCILKKSVFFAKPHSLTCHSRCCKKVLQIRLLLYVVLLCEILFSWKVGNTKIKPFFSLSLKNTNLSTSRLEFLSIRVPLFYVFKKHLFTSTSRYVFILALKNSRPTLTRSVDPRSSIG